MYDKCQAQIYINNLLSSGRNSNRQLEMSMAEFVGAVKAAIEPMSNEQLEGALFLIATLHDTLKNNWVQEGGRLTTLTIADIFDKLVHICSSLRVTTQRYKTGQWMSGALEMIDILRIQLRHLEGGVYDRRALVDILKELVEYIDDY